MREVTAINYKEIAQEIMDEYPYLREKDEKFISNLPPLFLQSYVNLYNDIKENGNFLKFEDKRVFEMIVFTMMKIDVCQEEDLWDMCMSKRPTKAAIGLREDLLQYIKENNIDKESFLQKLIDISNDNDIKSNIWNYDLRHTFKVYIIDMINNGRFELFDIDKKCKECGTIFTLTVNEQLWYKEQEFNLPERCPHCRRIRKYKK